MERVGIKPAMIETLDDEVQEIEDSEMQGRTVVVSLIANGSWWAYGYQISKL